MAQIFKSKDLTFAVPEKESDERPNCIGGTYVSVACTIHCTCTAHTFTYCTCTVHTPIYCTCTVHTITVCTFASHPTITFTGCTGTEITQTPVQTPVENDISQITDAETLKTLNDKLVKSLEEVKARQAELSKKK